MIEVLYAMLDRRARFLCLLCCFALLLTGCVSREVASSAGVTLPPAQSGHTAPENDVNQTYEQRVLLYLPSRDGTQLMAVPQEAAFSLSRHSAQTLCEMLFAHPGSEAVSPVGGEVTLSLNDTDAVEVSGGVATVSLAASALRLSHEQLFLVGQALANTLCQFGDLQYVNVLIAGVQPGLNIAATLPAGSFQPNTREELATLWERASAPKTTARRSFSASLYYPAPSGKGVLCEDRTLAFSELTLPAMARTLLEALAAGAEYLPGAPRCPELTRYLLEDPALVEAGGQRRLTLQFGESLNAALIEAGITRSVMMASLVYTLTTFLPGLDGVEISIGGERISTLTPSGTYNGVGETIYFTDGLMRRRDFNGFLLAQCTLYFADSQGKLSAVFRPIPYYETRSARALIQQLMLGPQPFDSQTGLSSVLPRGLREADLLGAALDGDTLVLNFSGNLTELAAGMNGDQERRMVYALVNTLTEIPGVKRVSFFILGRQPDTFAGAVYLPGDFLPNYNLILPPD